MSKKSGMLLLIACLLFYGCQAGASEDSSKAVNQNQKFKIIGRKKLQPEKDSVISALENRLFNASPKGSYDSVKIAARARRDSVRGVFQSAETELQREQIINEAGKLLTDQIVYELIPFWYRTRWSFEGHTEVPRNGTVACGYFVSTVLRDAGFKINRLSLPGSPSTEAYSISVMDSVKLLEGLPYSKYWSIFSPDDGCILRA